MLSLFLPIKERQLSKRNKSEGEAREGGMWFYGCDFTDQPVTSMRSRNTLPFVPLYA